VQTRRAKESANSLFLAWVCSNRLKAESFSPFYTLPNPPFEIFQIFQRHCMTPKGLPSCSPLQIRNPKKPPPLLLVTVQCSDKSDSYILQQSTVYSTEAADEGLVADTTLCAYAYAPAYARMQICAHASVHPFSSGSQMLKQPKC